MEENQKIEELPRESIIEKLAGANYGPREIAVYLGENTRAFLNQWESADSPERQAYDRGQLITQANVDINLAEQAQSGNITAAQQYKNSARDRAWANAFNPYGK